MRQQEITSQLYEWWIKVLKEVADSEASDWNNIQDIQTRAIKEN